MYQNIRPLLAIALLLAIVCAVTTFILQEVENIIPVDMVQTTTTKDVLVYENQEYGFEVTLTEVWKNYRVVKKEDVALKGVHHLHFQVPIRDMSYGDRSGYADPVAISVYPQAVWKQASTAGGPLGLKLGENAQYVFTGGGWQDVPEELMSVDFKSDEVMKSFKLQN